MDLFFALNAKGFKLTQVFLFQVELEVFLDSVYWISSGVEELS